MKCRHVTDNCLPGRRFISALDNPKPKWRFKEVRYCNILNRISKFFKLLGNTTKHYGNCWYSTEKECSLILYICILLKTLYVTFQYVIWYCWTLDVSRTASYEITLVHLSISLSLFLLSSVCPPVRPSVHLSVSNFVKIGSLVFSNILHDDSWPWYLVTDKDWKEFGGPNLVPTGQNQAQNEIFTHFLKFGLCAFLEIEYDDSFRQYLTSSRGKTHEKKNLGPKFWPNSKKSGPKLGF